MHIVSSFQELSSFYKQKVRGSKRPTEKTAKVSEKLYVVEVNLISHLHGNKSCALKVSGILLSMTLSLSNIFSVNLCLFKGFSLIKKICTKLPNESQNLDIREPIVF